MKQAPTGASKAKQRGKTTDTKSVEAKSSGPASKSKATEVAAKAAKASKATPAKPTAKAPPAPSVSVITPPAAASPAPPPKRSAPGAAGGSMAGGSMAGGAVAPTPAPAERDEPIPPENAVFKVGDKAVYPRGGVAEVIGIEELDIAGNRQRFYVLRLLQNNSKIRVPVGNANAVGLRQLISEQEILEVFDILRERTIAFDKQTWNRRYRGFMEKIKTGSIYDVAEVLRDLYRLKTDKQLSFGERRMLDEARSLIVKEIAIARDQTEEQVKNEIEAIFLTN
jgi:CarD family transcriptional regulator